MLVHDFRDATSAEAYCTLGGDVPGKIAQGIGDKYALQSWSSATSPLPRLDGYIEDCFDCDEQGEYAADAGDDGETEERCGWGC